MAGDIARVQQLLDGGADHAARNAFGATPLHLAIHDRDTVARLLAGGAAIDAAMPNGATPLLIAIARAGSTAVVDELLMRGADPTATMTDFFGVPLTAAGRAAEAGNAELVERLLELPRVRDDKRALGTALVQAAFRGHRRVVELLLLAGAPAEHDDFLMGHALNRALYANHRDVARVLLPHTKELGRRPGLASAEPTVLWAAYDETGEADLMRELLARGCDQDATALNGESVRRWAEKRGDTPLSVLLRERAAVDAGPARKQKGEVRRAVPADDAARRSMLRTSVQKSLTLLQQSSDRFLANAFVQRSNCVTCHQQSLPAVALGRARQRGLTLDDASLARQLWAQEREWRNAAGRAYSLTDPVPDAPNNLGWALLGLDAVHIAHDDAIEAMGWFLAESQQADGSFAAHHQRPPIEEGPIVGTALAAGALRALPPQRTSRRLDEVLHRAAAWLRTQRPASRNQQGFQLLGLGWAGAPRAELEVLAQSLVALQDGDGGVAPLPSVPADPWTTALVVWALQECGLASLHGPAIRRANDWLLARQHDDGSWWQESRSWPLQPHFDAGFPHGKDQWIAAAATALAAIVLLAEEPEVHAVDAFGTAQELALRHRPRRREAEGTGSGPATATGDAAPTFDRDVRPLFLASCAECHGETAAKGGLTLTTRAGVLAGGQSGEPAVSPGRPEASPLLHYVTGAVEDLEMPPLDKRDRYAPLTKEQVELVRAWILGGAR